jgi:hypothetical protein
MSPISVMFSVVQSLTIFQYFARERLSYLKDVRYNMMNGSKKSNKDKMEVKEGIELEVVINEKISNGELSEKRSTNEKRKTLNNQLDLNVNDDDEFTETEDSKKLGIIQRNIKIAKFLISDFVKMFLLFLFLIVFFLNSSIGHYIGTCWNSGSS